MVIVAKSALDIRSVRGIHVLKINNVVYRINKTVLLRYGLIVDIDIAQVFVAADIYASFRIKNKPDFFALAVGLDIDHHLA